MGMFDYIKCEINLPDTNKKMQKRIFQTKSFGCFLDTYIITKDKKLILISKEGNKTITYHGDINFYTSTGSHEDKTFKWYEYVARFTNGKVENIKKITKPNLY